MINAVFPNSFLSKDLFKAQPSGGPQNGILVVLDGFNNARVPIEVALLMAANFTDGLITRLVLGQFKRFWDSSPSTPQSPGYGFSQGLSLSVGALNANQTALMQFSDSSSYPNYTVIPELNRNTGSPTYQDDIGRMLAGSPITSIGMLFGWRAAEQIEQADDLNQTLVKSVFKLIGHRFSIRDLGEMTAFTLNYLNGAAKNESIQSIIKGYAPIAPPALNTLLLKVSDDPELTAAKNFLVGFENVLTAEFYALSQNTNLGAEKLPALSQHFNFLQGFHEGIAKAADAHYEETLELAFGLGYESGFADGYSLGYANGYSDGYAAGNAAAWKAANVIIDGLRTQIASLQQQLSQVQSAQNGGGSGAGFWDKIGNIARIVDTAVGVISTFAGAGGA